MKMNSESSDRKFYDLSEAHKVRGQGAFDETTHLNGHVGSLDRSKEKVPNTSFRTPEEGYDHRPDLAAYIHEHIIGKHYEFTSPFGRRQVVYCDYTASGKALKFIEDYILSEVLPSYGNTHTTTSVTSLQTTLFRHEAREILKNTIGASEEDALIFVSSGCTGAVHKLINGLSFSEPPIIFVGASEHHSNLLPWREIAYEVIMIDEKDDGLMDVDQLEKALISRQHEKKLKIGCFSAASNITGTLKQDLLITALLHRYGALSFWDYAAAAPYVKIAMNPSTNDYPSGTAHKDALYFSMHKFVGGVQTPGVLVVKKSLLNNRIPDGAGGGTVFFVSRESHRYLRDKENREEGGTPAIVESIRAGLVFKLKSNITSEWIMNREAQLVQQAHFTWDKIPELVLLGSTQAPRIAVFSFLVRHMETGYFLHHNFVCALLNDMYGIQARGGCACAGPYAQNLLGIDEELSRRYENILIEDNRLDRTHLRRKEEHSCYEVLRPGFARLNFSYFAPDDEVDFVIRAVVAVAKNGWKMLPYYRMNSETGEWHHQSQLSFKDRKWLDYVDFSIGHMRVRHPRIANTPVCPSDYEECLKMGEEIFAKALREKGGLLLADQRQSFNEEASALRWFLLPSEAQSILREETVRKAEIPFFPRKYSTETKDYGYQHFSTIPASSTLHTTVKESIEEDCNQVEPLIEQNGKLEEILDDPPSKSDSETFNFDTFPCDDEEEEPGNGALTKEMSLTTGTLWKNPEKNIMKPTLEALTRYKMINNGDRVLVCVSGGKDSLSLLHTLHQHQERSRRFGVEFDIGVVTVDPGSSAYDPSVLIPYMKQLGIPYYYERQCIINQAMDIQDVDSICSFCSRLKRGRIYATARGHGYNVIALGQHLDDLAESFLMSTFHNGRLRTMKAAYANRQRDLRIIRPFVYVRERDLRHFAASACLPVVPENCPACFEAPKERHRIKQLLAQQELLYPTVYLNIKTAILPLMGIDQPFVEKKLFGKQSYIEKKEQKVAKSSD